MKKNKKIGLALSKKIISSFEQDALKGGNYSGGGGGTSGCHVTGLSCDIYMCGDK